MSQTQIVNVKVNGVSYVKEVESRTLLSDLIRHELNLTGTHVGCEHGVCGACTVLIDGQPARSCLTLAAQASGKEIETVESLAGPQGELNTLQKAFWDYQGLQCGFCTPGILMTAEAFLEENPQPSREQIREVLSGHICRCTGYQDIVDSIEAAVNAKAEQNKVVNSK
jgi:aerobic-type carbon monoxide dehydrogenase small subunit (CoxS/CutS family)